MYTLEEIANITNGELIGPSHSAQSFIIDSRELLQAEGACFVALKTDRNNGHRYISSLIKTGVNCFIVNAVDYNKEWKGASFVVVEDTLKALQALAKHHRQQVDIPVIGITGSNGKTIVKEWLYQTLKELYIICRSPRSYNSQVGVPLSVLNLRSFHTLAIFEAGISKPGEMDVLNQIIQPTLGIFTGLGSAHDEGFTHRTQKLNEKFKLFHQAKTLVVNTSGMNSIPLVTSARETITIGQSPGNDLYYRKIGDQLEINYRNEKRLIAFPLSDAASISNAATVAGVLFSMGIKHDEVAKGLCELQPVALRLESRQGTNNTVIINDYYNSDLESLKIAVAYLAQQTRHPRKVVVVSDLSETGLPPEVLYQQVAAITATGKIDLLIGIGHAISANANLFPQGSLFFESTEKFISALPSLTQQIEASVILLKGARSFGFEHISSVLQLKSHDTVLEINLNHLASNINHYRRLAGPHVKLMCMVKAMGYGSGSPEVAARLQHAGVQYLAVAYADEGVELRNAGITLPVMVMSPEHGAFEDLIAYRLEPEIYSFRMLNDFVAHVSQSGITDPFPVHIKLDTGMHRLGFMPNEIKQLCQVLRQTPALKVASVFSHLAAADDPSFDKFTEEQIKAFELGTQQLREALGYDFIRHICNSGGIRRFPKAHFEMVRVGIGMYGIGVNEEEQQELLNVGSLRTRISQIKALPTGETVGYGRRGVVNAPKTIAVIPIGYADGFSRSLGNGKHGVYIHGQFCPTIGSICMDMCMVDVTGIFCTEGDEVTIFSNAAHILKQAEVMGTIPYEVLTAVSGRVKRVYSYE